MSPVERMIRARRHGIIIPRIAWQECQRTGLEYAVACAVLMRETSGGHNVFGHDPTIFVGRGTVTREKYLAYKKLRQQTGKMQGVGPMQLTWYGFQDLADKWGGCWIPRYNCRVGFKTLHDDIRQYGLYRALWHYNGARSYADAVFESVKEWRKIAGR